MRESSERLSAQPPVEVITKQEGIAHMNVQAPITIQATLRRTNGAQLGAGVIVSMWQIKTTRALPAAVAFDWKSGRWQIGKAISREGSLWEGIARINGKPGEHRAFTIAPLSEQPGAGDTWIMLPS